MERPKKRAKLGHAPHDPLPLDNVNTKVKVNKAGNSSNKTKKLNSSNGNTNDDNEDEIAMDPEDYAMKVDPEYRLDRSRAVAENKLKSAFELLFEKYGQDFGDTGDEVNFYTDEIEVDNGHIASLPANGVHSRPKALAFRADDGDDGDEDGDSNGYSDGDEEDGPDYESSQNNKPGTLSSRRDASRLFSLLPSRIGPGGTVIMGGPAHAGAFKDTVSTSGHDMIDPAWVAPEIPGLDFSTPGGVQPPSQPPRNVFTVPQRKFFRKTLAVGHTNNLHASSDSDDDDLLLDVPGHKIWQSSHDKEPTQIAASTKASRSRIPSTKTLTKRQEIGLLVKKQATASADSEVDAHRGQAQAEQNSSERDEPSTKNVPDSTCEDVGTSARGSSQSAVTGSTVVKSLQTYTRNTIDPSFIFSDEDDFGFKIRKKPQATKAVPADASITRLQGQVPSPKQVGAVGESSLAGKGGRAPSNPRAVKHARPERPRTSTCKADLSKKVIESDRLPHREENLYVVLTTAKAPPLREPASVVDYAEVDSESDLELIEREPAAATTPESHASREDGMLPKRTTTDRPQHRRRPNKIDTQKTTPLSTRKARRHEIPDSGERTSGIISLVSDGSADEAELEMVSAAAPPPFSSFGPGRSGGRLPLSARRSDGALSHGRLTPRTPSSRHRLMLMATPSRQQNYARALSRSPLARRQQALFQKESGKVPSPSGSVIQTPGGTLRRCGQDGFRCEREFCFRCT
ncbi:hypothetical protein SEPCBS57363_004273 [Sporothrix epigloea]|uniref:Centromere protein Scm3 n=1 Tax=Sporothrix epigloea TaxID=1892477 RepID=A0ABP0DT00_9PEZI